MTKMPLLKQSPYEQTMSAIEWFFSEMSCAENEAQAMEINRKMMMKCHRLIKEKPQGVGNLERKAHD